MTIITSPHDRLFKTAMSDIRVAREFFENYLPNEIREAINLDQLELCPKSYIDENLKSSESDILYKTQIGDESAYLYLLAEHQSSPDKLMAFRLLKYMINIWSDHLKQTEDKKLALIIPIVFYHGREPYAYSKDIRDLISAPKDLIDKVLFKPFHLIDTHDISDEECREHSWFGIMAFFMKHIFVRDFLPYLQESLSILQKLEQAEGGNYVITLLKYALVTAEIPSNKTFVEIVKEGLSVPIGENIMTFEQHAFERGKRDGLQQGIHQGVLQGCHEVLKRQLKRKFMTIPLHYQQLIEKANESQIYQWSENLIDAKTLEEVFS